MEKKTLSITEKEMKNPMIRRKIAELIILRAGFHSTETFIPISEAEVEIMKDVALFTPLKAYGKGKFPNEVGKLKGKEVCVVD
jgi:hypothetical protein